MKLLILTQKIDINDDLLGFMHGWVTEFSKQFENIIVVALGVGEYNLPANVKVLSLGKDSFVIRHSSFVILKKLKYAFNFFSYLWQERKNYDCVFVHMNSEYVVLGGWLWCLLGKKIGLWYAHGFVPLSLKIAEKFCDIIFTSTKTGCRLESDKIRVVGQGIDIKKFSPSQKLKDNTKFKIITVGRISPVKDYETFLDALEILFADNSIKERIEVKIIGGPGRSNQENYFKKLKKIVIERGLNRQVEFLGTIPFVEVDKYLKEADLMVNSSLTGSLDKTMIEAMACGVPVISCNESLEEILKDKQLMFAKGNSHELFQKIKDFFEMDHRARKAIGLQLRSVVEQKHSQDKLISKIVDLLK